MPPTNQEIIDLLEEIALLLDLAGESPFKSRAYTNVARRIEQADEDVSDLVAEGRLREIEGVGDALDQKITEFVETGKLEYHEKLRAKFPDTLFELFEIQGLGAKRIKQLYEDLDIKSMDELEAACNDGRIAELKGFGQKMQDKILQGISFAKQQTGQHLFSAAFNEAGRITAFLQDDAPVQRIEVAGSLRRRKEIVKDLDIIASSKDPEAVMKRFVEDDEVARVTGHGETKSSVILKSGIAADLRVVEDKQYPYALMHFTGSKEHNVVMRQRAKDKDLKLNEYGLFDGDKNLPCKEEKDIYKKLGLPYIPPEMREDMGEFDLKKTPDLVTIDDILGMIHCHSTWSDGRASIADMAKGAKERGYHYITMTDHSQAAAYANGLSPERVQKQQKEIDALNKKLKDFTVLKGIESDIRADGSLDYEDDILKTFEIVIISIHSGLEMKKADATKRIVKAIENPYTHLLGHPTGRLLLQRKGYELDYEKVFDACAANHVAIEINANSRRLDLDWRYVRQARDKDVMISIGPDAHSIEGLDDMQYGVGIARKGWLEPANVLNCKTLPELRKWLKK